MKKSNKLTAAVTASAVMAAMVVPAASAASASFNDIDSSFAKDAIVKLADLGILNGKGEGKFDPTGNVTRAEFAKILTLALKLDVSSAPASATFADVATDAWSYKYVEAAAKAKLINGVGNGQFGPNDMLSREDMAVLFVRALGADKAAGKGANLTFADKDSISDYAKDAVAYAVELGLINGKGDNKFDAKGNASREAIAKVANLFIDKYQAPSELKIEGDSNVGVGEKVQFTVKGALAPVWSVSGNGIIDQAGNFVANAAGEATVTATVGGKTVSQKVTVYGAAAAVKVGTIADLVANGVSTQEATVQVLDANGNPVENFNGTLDLAIPGTAAKFVSTNTVDFTSGVTVLNGVTISGGKATFKLVGAQLAGLTDTLTVNNVKAAGAANVLQSVYTSADVKTVAQVATTIKVTAPSTIGVNLGTEQKQVSANVVDQTGNPMLNGVYPLTFKISGGSATFLVGGTQVTTDDQAQTVVANGTASVWIQSVKGKTGPTNITVSSGSLTAGTATVNGAVVAGAAKLAFAIDSTSNTTFTQGGNASFTVSTQDANGVTTTNAAPGTTVVKVKNADGTPATNLQVGATPVPNDGTGVALGGTTFTVSAKGGVAAAGSYTVELVDTATSALAAAPAQNLTINASTADHISVSSEHTYVAAGTPNNTFTAQVVDTFGNKVAKSGVPVTFYALRTGVTGTATLNGALQDGSTQSNTVTVATDSNGVATVSLVPQSYSATWTVYGTPAGLDNNIKNAPVNVVPMTTAKLSASLKNAQGGSPYLNTTAASAGDAVTLHFDQLDMYGNKLPVGEDDTIKVVFSPANGIQGLSTTPTGVTAVTDTTANTVTWTGSVNTVNVALTGLTAGKAGAVSVTATDVSVPSASAATATLSVQASNVASSVRVLTPNNDSAKYNVATKGEVGPFTVQLVDKGGNPTVYTSDVNVSAAQIQALLNGTGTTATVSTAGVRTSVNGADSTSVKIPAGSSQVQIWVNVTTAGDLVPAAASALTGVLPAAPVVAGSGAINNANKAAYTVTGTAAGTNNVTVTLTDASGAKVTKTVPAVAGAYTATVDASILADGNIAISAVQADTAGNVGPASTAVTVAKDVAAPVAATAVTPAAEVTNAVASDGFNQIAVSWTASTSADKAGYEVYRSTVAGTTGTKVSGATVLAGTSFNDGAAALSTTYYYTVRTYDAAGNYTDSVQSAAAAVGATDL